MSEKRNDNLILWYTKPAEKWTQALPLGNGRIGAMVFGGVGRERICLNEDTLWSGFPRDTTDPGAGRHIEEAARLVREGKPLQAQTLIEEKVLGTWGQSYMPLGDMELTFPGHENCLNYRRELDLRRAVSLVEYGCRGVKYRRECFASAPDDGLVLRITASEPGRISFALTLSSKLRSSVHPQEDTLVLAGECPGQAAPNYVDAADPIIYGDSDQERGISFHAMVRVSHVGGKLCVENGGLVLSGADEATVCFTVKTSFNGFDRHPRLEGKETAAPCEAALAALSSKPYKELLKSHVDDYRSLFDRVSLDLGTDREDEMPTDQRLRAFARGRPDNGLYTLLFQFGRYLLISSSRPGSQAANLQGIWNEELRAPWSSNYTVNINTQMNYWPVFTCNLGELNMPLLQLIKDIAKSGRKTAQVYYNARGFTAHHNIDLWRITTPVGPRGTKNAAKYGFWPMSAAWLCRHAYEQYEFTGDKDYLKNEALPLLKEACLFCLDILSPDGNGHLWACPSTSPENEYLLEGEGCGVAATSTMTMTVIRDLFKNCIQAMNAAGDGDELKTQLENVLPRLYPYRTGSRGQLLEWSGDMEGSDPHHRHLSHLYGLYPACEFTYDKTPELMEACRLSLDERGDGGTGWSLGWKVNLWARLRDGDRALRLLQRQLRPAEDEGMGYGDQGGTYDNLFDAHPPFQIDGNFGATAGMAEMLLQSHEGYLHLLPALPKDWPDGYVNGLVGRGNVTVSLRWREGILREACITPRFDGKVTVRYRSLKAEYPVISGETVSLDGGLRRL